MEKNEGAVGDREEGEVGRMKKIIGKGKTSAPLFKESSRCPEES